jgi:DNA primase
VIGSAITEKHIQQIKKLTRRVTLALDPDAAGESATVRGITVAQNAFDRVLVPVPMPTDAALADAGRAGRRGEPRGMVRFEEQVDAEITVARLPDGEDPDEFVRRDNAGWQRTLDEAVPLIDFLFEAQTAGLALDTPQGKMEACRRLLPLIAEVRSRTLAGEYVDRLATKLRLDVKDLQRDLQLTRARLDREARARPHHVAGHAAEQARSDAPADSATIGGAGLGEKYRSWEQEGSTADATAPAAPPSMTSGATGGLLLELAHEEYCLGLLLEHPETWAEMRAILDEGDFTTAETRALFAALSLALAPERNAPGSGGASAPVAPDVLASQLDPLLHDAAARGRARVARAPQVIEEGPGLLKQASQAAYRLKRMRLKAEQAELDYLIRDAEQSSDPDGLRSLLARKQRLLAERRTIDEATSLQA